MLEIDPARSQRLRYATEVVLDLDRILRLSSAGEIMDLEREYGLGLSLGGRGRLDWKEIALRFDGIIVSPFCDDWRVLQKTCWYHEWDCASGCVWKKRAVLALKSL